MSLHPKVIVVANGKGGVGKTTTTMALSGILAEKYKVLAVDAYKRFQKEGIFNQKTGKDFLKHILKPGGSEEPMTLFQRFRGKIRRFGNSKISCDRVVVSTFG